MRVVERVDWLCRTRMVRARQKAERGCEEGQAKDKDTADTAKCQCRGRLLP